MELFDRAGLRQVTGLTPRKLELLLRLLKAPTLDRIYRQLDAKQGIDMIEDALNYLGIHLDYDQQALQAAMPKEGPFITVSNHPFGFLDGIILLLIVGRQRPEFRVVANFLLSYFAPISDLFITVNPFEKGGPRQMNGMRKSLQQLEQGLGLGVFPAGEVSTWYKGQSGIADREWSLSTMRMIQKAKVPVIPVYFHGHNSRSFHVLGKVHPALRTLRIPAEFLKKRDHTIQLGIGERMEWSELEQFQQPAALREHLYAATYALKACD
ncbi:hypothetical protein CHH28_11525 [Bacterioplanes sanyensis]|uniref:Phospholipid/glycerol acyltransferase domain-containing protein n=1 Tax=Bacterioplanes sanyensis TaxID=1249553 RepID=A0A222FL00_9GAMM|nr:lysophospholipid acyltransferase family protein [Bacterioplanes sanyensis]ASP39266.1 hypothetical protein CHH28_11525 [Bacterioplanes sanyensis]